MFHDEKHVMVRGCTIVWDGITVPEMQTQGKNAGKPKYSLKLVVPPNCPDLADLQNLSQTTLNESEFRGVLPAGGFMPISQTKPGEFNDLFPGYAVISAKSQQPPQVFDENGQTLDAMQYGPALYSGQLVDVLLHCYAFNQQAKGVSAGLDGFSIIASANAPRQVFGSRVDAAAAFGGGAGPQPAGQPVQQPGAPVQQPAYGQPAGQPVQQPGAPVQQPAYGQPAGQPVQQPGAPVQQPAYGQPQQAAGPAQPVPPAGYMPPQQ